MKDEEDDEEVKPPIMYEVYLRNERVQEGITRDLGRKGWANVMVCCILPRAASLAKVPNAFLPPPH